MIKFRMVGEKSEITDLLDALAAAPGIVIRREGLKPSRDQEGKYLQYGKIGTANPPAGPAGES